MLEKVVSERAGGPIHLITGPQAPASGKACEGLTLQRMRMVLPEEPCGVALK